MRLDIFKRQRGRGLCSDTWDQAPLYCPFLVKSIGQYLEMERAVPSIPIFFCNPYLNLSLLRAAPPTNSWTLRSRAFYVSCSLTATFCSFCLHLEIPSLALQPSVLTWPHLPHLNPAVTLHTASLRPSLRVPSRAVVPISRSGQHKSLVFLTPAAPRLPNMTEQMYATILGEVRLHSHLLWAILGGKPPNSLKFSDTRQVII